jgi:hypothetical protein
MLVIPTPNVAPTQKSCLYPNYIVRTDMDAHVQAFRKTFKLIILVLKLLQHVKKTWVMTTKNCWSLLQNQKI